MFGSIGTTESAGATMGAWGPGPFENDDASDWVYELEATPDVATVRHALDVAITDYLQAPEASIVLAAGEVVAAARQQAADSLPDAVSTWITEHGPLVEAADAVRALAAVDRVLAEESELMELWAEAGDIVWREAVQDLRRRLGAR